MAYEPRNRTKQQFCVTPDQPVREIVINWKPMVFIGAPVAFALILGLLAVTPN